MVVQAVLNVTMPGWFHWDWFRVPFSSLFPPHTVFALSSSHAQSSRRESLQGRWLHLHWCQHWWPLAWQGKTQHFTTFYLAALTRLSMLSPSLPLAKTVQGSRRTTWSSASARSPKKLDSETLGIASITPCATTRWKSIRLLINTDLCVCPSEQDIVCLGKARSADRTAERCRFLSPAWRVPRLAGATKKIHFSSF